jgi:hypothetical protein
VIAVLYNVRKGEDVMKDRFVKKSIVIVMICSLLTMLFTNAEVTNAEETQIAPVTLYSDSSFCGISQNFSIGNHNVDEFVVTGGVGNDTVDSIRIAPGYKVTLYSDAGYSGSTEVLTTNRRDISLANSVSSIKIELTQAHLPVIVYADAEWSGTAQEFGLGDFGYSDLSAGVGNDKMTSLRIAPGYQVTLYKDAGFNGSTVILTQDIVNLKTIGFNDAASSMKIQSISPVDNTCIAINSLDDTTMASLLSEFAPRIWMAQGESYWASSIDWAFDYLERYFDTGAGKYCLRTKEALSSPTTKLPFFSGNQGSARCYAFWTEKDFNNIDLSYWQYCPYNFGKVVVGMEFGDHVGDWEHVTVRLSKFTYEGITYVKPTMVAFPYHSSISLYQWSEVAKVTGTNHVIAYSAKESHGMWKDLGNHVYQNIVIAQLTDECSAGTAMDCWTILNTYEYKPGDLSGRGLGGTSWTTYFDADYDNPSSNSVHRWGNPGQGSAFGQPILGNGPAGPEGHDALYDWVILR